MMRLSHRWVLAGCGLLWLVCALPVHAQLAISANPANRNDPHVLFANPAAISGGLARAYLGLKLIYPGAISNNAFAMKASLGNLAFSNLKNTGWSAGLSTRVFTAPLFSEYRLGILAARDLTERISTGVELALHGRNYASENFDLVDANDPVFQGRTGVTVFDPGIGALYRLTEKMTLGAAAHHLLRPNIALGRQKMRTLPEYQIGMGVAHDFVQVDLGVHYWQYGWRLQVGSELLGSPVGRVRLGYALRNVHVDGQLNLRNQASLFYSFNLPASDLGLISAGSHELGLVYDFRAKREMSRGEAQPAERAPVSTPPKEHKLPRLYAEIRALAEEVMITESRQIQEELPLIPRVFFARNSAVLAESRYDLLQEGQPLSAALNVREINAAYRNLLNIIAERLRTNPEAGIQIHGYSPGLPVEEAPESIALKRANYVRKHLVENLRVDARQVSIALGKPELNEGRSHDPKRLEELQRAEVLVDPRFEEAILAPIMSFKKEIDALPRACSFIVSAVAPGAGLAGWSLALLAEQDTVDVIRGRGRVADTLTWDWRFDPDRRTSFWRELRYTLRLYDRSGQVFDTPARTITGRQAKMEELRIEKIPIILFGFDDDRVDLASPRLRKKLQQIAGKLNAEPSATCSLYGHTDEIGEEEHNAQLSARRANNVLAELVRLGVNRSRLSSAGYGERRPLADNRLPEGRMLNRRVEVHIRHVGEAGRN